jgi:hypothetical protein
LALKGGDTAFQVAQPFAELLYSWRDADNSLRHVLLRISPLKQG